MEPWGQTLIYGPGTPHAPGPLETCSEEKHSLHRPGAQCQELRALSRSHTAAGQEGPGTRRGHEAAFVRGTSSPPPAPLYASRYGFSRQSGALASEPQDLLALLCLAGAFSQEVWVLGLADPATGGGQQG